MIDFETGQAESRVAAMHGFTTVQVATVQAIYTFAEVKHVETSLLTRARPQLSSLVTDALMLAVTALYRMTSL